MSSDAQPASKRKRAEDTPEESTPPVTPVKSSIWYRDGNIILQAEGTRWKVHQGILAESSSIFQDMFSLPQPPRIDAELVEGCPVVQLSDSAEEVEYVLQAICKRECVTFCSLRIITPAPKLSDFRYVGLEEALPLPVISAFIRLGKKYNIHKLHVEGRKRIFNEFPADLPFVVEPAWKFVAKPEHRFELVIFARTTEVLSILPFVFYICCRRYQAAEIAQGAKRKDGTIVSISMPDQIACLMGYNAIYGRQARTSFSWAYIEPPPAGCTSKRCTHIRDEYLKEYFTVLPMIRGLDNLDKVYFRHLGLCSVCADKSEEMNNEGRQVFWRLLPSLFGLPPWEELCKEREVE